MPILSFPNGIQIELRTRGKTFLGIGAVRAGRVKLRSRRRPMFVEIVNPAGVELSEYTISRQEMTDAGLELEFSVHAQARGQMEWMVHTVRNRYNAVDWTETPRPASDTTLRLIVKPVSRTIGDLAFTGLSYQYVYRSATIPIYKILDRGTWEIGGRAVGSEFWMRNSFVPSIARFESIEQFHSTEWYLPSADNPNVFQFLPLQTELQGFTFTASNRGLLVTWATQVAHVRSLFEKPRGGDEIVHWHQHCGDLAHEFSTSPVEVLWSPGRLDRVGRSNGYEAVRDMVHAELHAQIGLARQRITTYGQIEEWGPADMARYAAVGVPRLLAAGVRTINLANHFQNNMNTWGVSNFCCTVDYQFAPAIDPGQMRDLCGAAHAGRARVEMWGNTALSTLSYIFNLPNGNADRIRFLAKEGSVMEALGKAAMPWVRNPSNAIEADHYTPVFCAMNLRDPVVCEYWLRRWKEAHDNVGLDGIFLDSSFNLSSDKFHFVQNTNPGARSGATADQLDLLGHYRPAHEPPQAILSQYRAHLDLMVAMERIGYHYCNEDLGVFGTHRHGPGIEGRLDSLPIWTECLCGFDVPAILKLGGDPDDVFFRGLAYRMMWIIHWNIDRDVVSFHPGGHRADHDRPTAWHLALLAAFNEAGPLMLNRRILTKETGVIYRAGDRQVLWCFSDLKHVLDAPRSVRDLITGVSTVTGRVAAQKHHVYLIEAESPQMGTDEHR